MMMLQYLSPFTSSKPPRFWKEDVVLISIGYTTEKMAPTDKNRREKTKKKRDAAADDHPDRIGPRHSLRRTMHTPIDIDLCSSSSSSSSSSSNKEREREKEHPFLKPRDEMDYDDKNENNNEPFFIPIARTFTVVDDREEDRREEAFFVFDDDRTTLITTVDCANMMMMRCLRCFLCRVGGKTFVCWSSVCGLFFTFLQKKV